MTNTIVLQAVLLVFVILDLILTVMYHKAEEDYRDAVRGKFEEIEGHLRYIYRRFGMLESLVDKTIKAHGEDTDDTDR